LSLALDTGLRASELARLDLKHLDLESRCLQVLSKGFRWKRCFFSEVTASRLREWLDVRRNLAGEDVDTVFCGLELNIGKKGAGRPMNRNGILQVFKRLGKNCGMELTVHTLRRSFATLSIRRGASTRLVQLQGGWSSSAMVERYTQALQPEDFIGHFATEPKRVVQDQ
jgi:integrase/recombinase XerC